MILSKQPGDTGIFATATASRIVAYDLQSVHPADFFSAPWYSKEFHGEAPSTTGFTTPQRKPLSLSTQALHVSRSARPANLNAHLTAQQGDDYPPLPSTNRASAHDSVTTALPYYRGSGGAPSPRTAAGAASIQGGAAVVSPYPLNSQQANLTWTHPLPPCLVIDLRAPHTSHYQPTTVQGDASLTGSALATTMAGPVFSPHRPAVGADGAEVLGLPMPPPPAPLSSAPSHEYHIGAANRRGTATRAGGWPQASPPSGYYSQYTGSVVNNSFLSTSVHSANGGNGAVLADPVTLSLSCGSPQYQIFMADRSGAAWIGTSARATVTRIHIRHRHRSSQHRARHRSSDRGDDPLPTTGAQAEGPTSHAHRHRSGTTDSGERGDDSDKESDGEEDLRSGDAEPSGTMDGDTNGGSSGVDVNVISTQRGSPTAVFPSRITASGWDPRSATTLAVGRHDGVVQLLDVEHLVGGVRGGDDGGADLVPRTSGTYVSEDDDDDVVYAEDGPGAERTTEARTTMYACTNSNDGGTTTNIHNDPTQRRRRVGHQRSSQRHSHRQHTYYSSVHASASAARIEYSTVQQCLLEGPVTALDWVPQSHTAVVASRRQSGLGYSMRQLDLRTPDKGAYFGGDGDVLCYAEKIACDPSQRFVATVASDPQRDLVQLWDVRLTAKPLTQVAYARVGYTSLCWIGASSATREAMGGGGTGANAMTLLAVTRQGRVRLHDFTEDSNGFPLHDGALPFETSPPTGSPRRRARSLFYTRCSLDDERGDAPTAVTTHAPDTTARGRTATPAAGAPASSAGTQGTEPESLSASTTVGAAFGTAVATAFPGAAGVRRTGVAAPTDARWTEAPPLRLPVHVPTAAVAWVAAPLPAHPTSCGEAGLDGETTCTPGLLTGRGCRLNLPFALLLHEQTGDVYAQVYNRYGAVAAVASVSGHVLVAAGPNVLWTNIARLVRQRLPLPAPSSSAVSSPPLTTRARDPSSTLHTRVGAFTGSVPAGDAGDAAEARVSRAIARAQLGFSADPTRNLAILLDEGRDKEAYVLFRYGVVLSRHLFPALAGDDGSASPLVAPKDAHSDGSSGPPAGADGTTPVPPVPIGQYVPGVLELIRAEWQQRECLNLLHVALPLRITAASTRTRRTRRLCTGEDDDSESADEEADDDALSQSDDASTESTSGRDTDEDSTSLSRRSSHLDARRSGATADHEHQRTSATNSSDRKRPAPSPYDDEVEGDTVANTRTTTTTKRRKEAALKDTTTTASPTTAVNMGRKVTLPNLRLFRGRPLAVPLPGMFTVGGSIAGTTAALSTSATGPRDTLLNGGAARHRLLGVVPRKPSLSAVAAAAAATVGGRDATSTTNTAAAGGSAPSPVGIAELGSLRGLLLAGLGWRRSAHEQVAARAAAQEARRVDVDGEDTLGSASGSSPTTARMTEHETQRISHYFVDGDGIGVHHLQEAVERRVALLVLQDRLREASEVVAHYSRCHPLYPTLALEISAAGMAAAAAADEVAGSATPTANTASAAARADAEAHAQRRRRHQEMERRLRYMHQRTAGCTFWMSLALTYIDMIVLQRPSGLNRGASTASHAATSPAAVSPSSSPRPPLRKAPGSGLDGSASRTTSPQPEAWHGRTPRSRPLSPMDAALPFAALPPFSDHHEEKDGEAAAPRSAVGASASAAEAVEFYGRHTPHVGLSHLTRSAQPAFFLALLARFPTLPVSDQLGMAVALLLPPRYTGAHLENLRSVLETLSMRQYNATFHSDCALLDAVGGGAAVLFGERAQRRDDSAHHSRHNSRRATPLPENRADVTERSRASHALVPPAAVHDEEDGVMNHHNLSSRVAPLPSQSRTSAGDGATVPLPPLHPRAPSAGAVGRSGEFLGGGLAPELGVTPPSPRDGPAGTAATSSSRSRSLSPASQASHTVVAGGPRLLLAAVVEGMRGSLQRYVDATGDVQTPQCYVAAFGLTRTATYRLWREAYRGLLNEAGCYLLRSQHDLCCVKVIRRRGEARVAARDTFHVPQPGFAPPGTPSGSAMAVPSRFSALMLGDGSLFTQGRTGATQGPAEFENPHRAVELRCNCGQAMHAVAPVKGSVAAAATSKAQVQQIPCGNPECRQRQTPMCTVCGERLEHKSTELSAERSFTWCTTCLHGGHWCHLREWFTKHHKCPVEECLCECGGCQGEW